ncbi:unnamed protein product, partial [Ixodes persulcatus]
MMLCEPSLSLMNFCVLNFSSETLFPPFASTAIDEKPVICLSLTHRLQNLIHLYAIVLRNTKDVFITKKGTKLVSHEFQKTKHAAS